MIEAGIALLDVKADLLTDALNEMIQAEDVIIVQILDTEDYDYTYVWAGSTETIIMKTIEGKAVALVYEDEEFAAFEDSYTRDNRTSYLAIVNSYVKETIKGGSGIRIKRHKGSKAIDR